MLLRNSGFVLKRVLREITALGILFITPIVLITILGMISDGAVDEVMGIPRVDSVALSMILAFQLFAGFYTLELINQDLISKRKWKLLSLPIQFNRYMYSIILVTTFYGGLQSYIITHYTRIVYGVTWGNQLRLAISICLVSLVVQLIYLNIALYLKNYKSMERAGTALGLISMGLGGVWFQIPDVPVLKVLTTYGNPYSLAKNILLDGMKNQTSFEGNASIIMLIVIGGLLVLASELKGRRIFR